MSLNRVMVIGNLGSDPELRRVEGGIVVANLSVATNDVYQPKGGQRTAPEWHRVVVFGKLAETCCQYLHKGRQVFVEGRLRTRSFVSASDGASHERTEIIATRVSFLGSLGPAAGETEDARPTEKASSPD
jgi:single-strand DNA-binding protein